MMSEGNERKRIWEVDCLSMDAVLAVSFEWRDLANILQGHGVDVSMKGPEDAAAMQVHNLVHRYCHSDNDISLTVESVLNLLHQHTMEQISHLDTQEVMDLALHFNLSNTKRLGGIFWAIGTEGRKEFECIRRRFHQRFQILALRDLATAGREDAA